MLIVGLMSGTSADGIDAALCRIEGEPPHLRADLIHATSNPYQLAFQRRIVNSYDPELSRVDELCQLHFELGERFAQAAHGVIEAAGMSATEVDLIGSHGQTFWHAVSPAGRVLATLQLTEASVIAERTGITTVSNLRARDVAAGGEGAPLTSYVDWLLLRHPTHWRAIQNIGGIGNVTLLPPLNDTQSAPLAFDTGPGNALIDSAVSLLSRGEQSYDRDAELAQSGEVDSSWMEDLLDHAYYDRRPPKTTGRELFSAGMAAQLIADGQQRGLSPGSIVATITAVTSYSIADAYQRFAPAPIAEVILGGGGRHNPALVAHLRSVLHPTVVLTHEDIGMDSDAKEALVFAVLAHETWHNRPGSLPALTGVQHPVVLGQITPGANYGDIVRRTWGNDRRGFKTLG